MSEEHGVEEPGAATRELFTRWVHSALRQLYDFPALERHPLAACFGRPGDMSAARAQQLRRALMDAIQALRPDPGTPVDAPDWRSYRILQLRYIEGLAADEAMAQLALQKTQYYADQARALGTVTDRLWERYQPCEPPSPGGLVDNERERLAAQARWEEIDPLTLLDELRSVLEPLAAGHGATLRVPRPPAFAIRRAKRVLLRQAILQAASYALTHCPAGTLEISGFALERRLGLRVHAWSAQLCPAPDGRSGQAMRLKVCRQLMVDMGGKLEAHEVPGEWEAEMVWEQATEAVLLVVDDNQDFVGLFQRYLAGHPWRVLGATGIAELQQMIGQSRPTVIILDVLMPQEDGWELLISLKADPATSDIPVIVCSVLREPSLALSLGAASFLPKPVSEKSLVEALAPWTADPDEN